MSLKKKLLIAYKNKTLIKKIKEKIKPYYQGLIYKFISKSNDNIKIHSPKLIQTNDKDLDITTRIFKSYKKMKDNEFSEAIVCATPCSSNNMCYPIKYTWLNQI